MDGRNRFSRVARVGRVALAAGKGGAVASIAPDAGLNYLLTAAAPHGLVGGETIVVSGNSEPTYNKTWPNIEAPSDATRVVLSTGGDATLTGTGGTWRVA